MLKLLRKKMKLILWITTILVVPTFVVWGTMVRFGEKRGPAYAGIIFGRKVSFDEYSQTFREVDQQNRRMYGDNYSQFAKFINLEEQTILPEARKHLTEQDWLLIYTAFSANGDPRFDADLGDGFKSLYSRIMNLADK